MTASLQAIDRKLCSLITLGLSPGPVRHLSPEHPCVPGRFAKDFKSLVCHRRDINHVQRDGRPFIAMGLERMTRLAEQQCLDPGRREI
mmetsp:Transcript_5101/g.10343  ORF Transcript_5101/g.10343 Transcript_5101/m.10343 type:complete len:88 (-) Transcript_5101:1071-1334(-)